MPIAETWLAKLFWMAFICFLLMNHNVACWQRSWSVCTLEKTCMLHY